MNADLILLAVLVPVMIAAAQSDLRRLLIPNSYVLVALALFMCLAPFMLPWHEIALRTFGAGVAFAIGFVLFAFRLMGGGDVKMMAVLMLFVPSAATALFLQLFSLALVVVGMAMVIAQRAQLAQRLGWESVQSRGKMPVGLSMALAVCGLLAWLGLGQ